MTCEQSSANQLFQEQHYQSLARVDSVVKVDPEEKTRLDSGFEDDLKEENLKRGEEHSSMEEEEEEYLSRKEEEEELSKEQQNQIKLKMDPNPTNSGSTRFEDERNGNDMVQTYVRRSRG